MHFQDNTTYFANLTARNAYVILGMLFCVIVYGLVTCRPVFPVGEDRKSEDSDSKLYRRIVERVHAGEPYYKVAGDELRTRGYVTKSVFNWRLPTLAIFLGYLPNTNTGNILAIILSSITLFVWIIFFRQNQYSLWQTMLGTLVMTAPLIYSLVPDPFLFHEFWAGTLILLSLGAYGGGWRSLSVISGLMALYLRELTLPFVFIMLVSAHMEGRRHEALCWLIGMCAFSVGLLIHWSVVSTLITETDLALKGGWIAFGGWPFVISTAQLNPYLLMAPPSVTAVILPFALLGLIAWRSSFGLRIACTVGAYIVAFSVVGLPFNQYWGLMYTMLMPIGLVCAPYALRDIWKPIGRSLRKVDG